MWTPFGRLRETLRSERLFSHPGGVLAVPILDDGRLVLIRQFRYPLQKYILEFPAGKLDSHLSPRRDDCARAGRGGRLSRPGIDPRMLVLHLAGHQQRAPASFRGAGARAGTTAPGGRRTYQRRALHPRRVSCQGRSRRDHGRQDSSGIVLVSIQVQMTNSSPQRP